MADVGVGEQDPVHRPPAVAARVRRFSDSSCDGEVRAWRRSGNAPLAVVDQAERGDPLAGARDRAAPRTHSVLRAADVRHPAVLRDPQHDRAHGAQPPATAETTKRPQHGDDEQPNNGEQSPRVLRLRPPRLDVLRSVPAPSTAMASRMASATSLPRLPTSPTGPTHDGQPSRHGAGGDERVALREQPVVQAVERLGEADAARVVVVDEDLRLVVVARARAGGCAARQPAQARARCAPRPGRCRPGPPRGRGGRTSGTAPPSGPACRTARPRRRAAPRPPKGSARHHARAARSASRRWCASRSRASAARPSPRSRWCGT